MPSSKSLVHWSGKDIEKSPTASTKTDLYLTRLKDWYQNGLYARKTTELILRLPGPPGKVNKVKLKHLARVCFTEVRMSEAEDHSARYGKLGIGFNRDFIANKGGRPVVYVPWEAQGRLMEENLWEAYQKSAGQDEIHKPLKWLLTFVKLMSNGEPEDSRTYENYYDEMEWRVVYGESLDKSGTFVATSDPDVYRMPFDPSDVGIIVFPNDDVKRVALGDTDMRGFFAKHQPDMILLESCPHL